MHRWSSLDDVPADLGPTVATLGNFDGVHRGHQAVLGTVVDLAAQRGLAAVAVTFDPHPAQVHRPGTTPPLLTGLTDRLALLAEVGIDATLVVHYTLDFADQSPEEFVTTYLLPAFPARTDQPHHVPKER